MAQMRRRARRTLSGSAPYAPLRFFDVKSYGAVGSGLVEDHVAIQAAITACAAAGGGIVFFPAGIYVIGATITVPSSVTLMGVAGDYAGGGYGVTALGSQISAQLALAAPMFNVSGSSWVTITQLTVRGPNATNTISGISDDSSAATYVTVERCRFYGLGSDTIRLQGSVNVIQNNSFRNPKGAGHGVYLHGGASDSIVRGNDMGGGDVALSRGILLEDPAQNCLVEGNMVYNFAIGIYLKGTGANNHRVLGNRTEKNTSHGIQDDGGNNQIHDNLCFNNGSGIGAGTSAGIHLSSCSNSSVHDNHCKEESAASPSGVQKVGILLNGCSDCDVQQNHIGSVTAQGILVTGAVRNTVSWNHIRSTAGIGITVQTASTDNQIVGNNLKDVSGTGVLIQTSSLRNRVASNFFRGSYTQCIKVNASVDTDNIVENNDTNGATISGSAIVDNGARTIIRRTSDPAGFGFPFTVDAETTGAVSAWPATNRAVWNRVKGSGTASKIAVHIGTASGNVAACIHANSGEGAAATPAAQLATSGSVACPSAGYAEISVVTSVAVAHGNHWFGFAADNTTVTVMRGENFGSASAIFNGVAMSQSSAFPPPDPAVATGFGWATHMVGVA